MDKPTTSSCCAKPYEYRPSRFVTGEIETAAGAVPRVSTESTLFDRLGTVRVRMDIGRMDYRVPPGLCAVGQPTPESPVLVTANYKLTFDCVRSELSSRDAWILVLDTRGVNVWCAAGKRTFSTGEIVKRVQASGLDRVVAHRTLIVPQLGATGVAKHLVRQECGFNVVYGPVRASDLPAFLDAGMKATPEMRTVRFDLRDRAAVVGVEASVVWNWRMIVGAVVAAFLAGLAGSNLLSPADYGRRLGIVYGLLVLTMVGGGVLVPLALPHLPGRAFSTKGALVGAVLGGVAAAVLRHVVPALGLIGIFLAVAAMCSYTAMNFTGSSTFTSPSGVLKEMKRALPLQVGAAAAAMLLFVAQLVVHLVA
jgi:hypothetical protein